MFIRIGVAVVAAILLAVVIFVLWPQPPDLVRETVAAEKAAAAVRVTRPGVPLTVDAPLPPGAVTDSWEKFPVVQSSRTASVDGRIISQVRVLKTDFKYPYVRVEETLAFDAGLGRERLVQQVAMVADHFMVRLKPGVSEQQLLDFAMKYGINIRHRQPLSKVYLLNVPSGTLESLPGALDLFKNQASPAEIAEPDYIVQATITPNDPMFGDLWGMHNTGQSSGTPDADIDAPEAWDTSTGSSSVLVGIIDTGIDQDHPDLVTNLWTNPAEIAGNGIDDDHNGYVDDARGWDFVNNDNNPDDDNKHGTHCAGTIGAKGNNALGVAGVCWTVKMVALKFLSGSGSGTTSDAIEAVTYATSIGVNLTSNSWGGGGSSSLLADAIAQANTAGILFVAAAGNASANNDSSPNYPSNYPYDNVIAVAASTRTGSMASFSSYGLTTVDLGAPGESITSTINGGGYGVLSGTSMATPHVAGACALLKAAKPSLTGAEIKAILLASVDTMPAFSGKVASGGCLNIAKALQAANGFIVSPSNDFQSEGPVGGPFTVTSKTYTLKNLQSSTVSWSIQNTTPWITITPASGILAPGGQTTVMVSLGGQATLLPAAVYNAAWLVKNGSGQTLASRSVGLSITPPPVLSYPMNTLPAGWTASSPWAFGIPTGQGGTSYGYPDPAAGATGANVCGVNLFGNYSTAIGGPYYLTTAAINLSQYTGTKLKFKRWLNTDYVPYVYTTVEISTNGSTWTVLWTNPSGSFVQDNAWTTQSFDIASLADGKSTVYFRWGHRVGSSGAYPFSGWNLDDIEILGTPKQSLAVTLPATLAEGAQGSGTVTVSPVPTQNLTVFLSSGAGGTLQVPSSVVIPAGSASVSFTATTTNDTILNGTRTVSVTAAAPSYLSGQATTAVNDDETAVLDLVLPASITEGGASGTATLTVSQPVGANVTVTLTASLPAQVTLPASVVIPSGASQVSFQISAVDDALLDGDVPVSITASVTNWTDSVKSLTVKDNEATTLQVQLPASLNEGAGTVSGGVVKVSGALATARTVQLASSDTSELQVPSSVTIPAGASSVAFNLTLPDDALADGEQQVTVTATSPPFDAGSAQTVVRDNEAVSFAFATIASPQEANKPIAVTVTALDVNGVPASGFPGQAGLTASGLTGTQPVTPATTGTFVNGVWSGNITLNKADKGVQLTASHSNGATGLSNTFGVVVSPVQIIPLQSVAGLVYSSGMKRLLATTTAGQLIPINPETNQQDTAVSLGTSAAQAVLSPDQSRLYVAVESGTKIRRVNLPDYSLGTAFTLGSGSYGAWTAEDITVLNGAADAVAVSLQSTSISPRHQGVAVFDGGVRRSAITPTHTGSNRIEAGSDPARVYGYNNETSEFGMRRMTVSSSGIVVQDVTSGLFSDYSLDIAYGGGLLFSTNGKVVNPETLSTVAMLPYSGLICPDFAKQRVYQLEGSGSTLTLRSYRWGSFDLADSMAITGASGTPYDLIRWGDRGLAFRTSAGQLVIVQGTLVPDAEAADLAVYQIASPNPAPVGGTATFTIRILNQGLATAKDSELACDFPPNASVVELRVQGQAQPRTLEKTAVTTLPLGDIEAGTERLVTVTVNAVAAGTIFNAVTASSPQDAITVNNQVSTSVAVQPAASVPSRIVPLDVKDVVYDWGSGKLYATTGSNVVGFGNGLLAIDPSDASIDAFYALGGNPGKMALAKDGSLLYVAQDGAASVQPFDPVHRVVKTPFSLGVSSSYGSLYAEDLDVAPGNPARLAVSRYHMNITPRHNGVAVYDNGVKLAAETAVHTGANVIAFGTDPGTLYGYCSETSGFNFYRIAISGGGAVMLDGTPSLIGSYDTDIEYGWGRIFSTLGDVIDPVQKIKTGKFTVSGPVEPDPYVPRVYYVGGTSSSKTITGFDTDTLAQVSSTTLAGISGTARNLVRCGSNGLAFSTSAGQLILFSNAAAVPNPPLVVTLPGPVTEGAGLLPSQGTVKLAQTALAPVTVQLTSSQPDLVQIPASVTIPAGALQASFPVTISGNTLLQGPGTITVTAEGVANYLPGTASILVYDDETTTVSISLNATILEGQIVSTGGQVTLGQAVGSDLTVLLSSGNPSRLSVPATVVIPQGQTSASFALTGVENDLIDGPATVQVSASVPGWNTATGSVTVLDNEIKQLSLSMPASVDEDGSTQITVNLGGKTLVPVSIVFVSGDTTEIENINSVTIPAGSSSRTVYVYGYSDGIPDGDQACQITASATGFISGSGSITVKDKSIASIVWQSVPSEMTAGVASSVQLKALTITGIQANYSGSFNISALAGEVPVPVTPSSVYMSSGVATVSVVLTKATAQTRLTATKSTAPVLTVQSQPFAVVAGSLGAFSWDTIPSPQVAGVPFNVTVRAMDAYGNPAASFAGSAGLAAAKDYQSTVVGTDAASSSVPLYASFEDCRSQWIYKASEMGVAQNLRSMSLNVASLPGQTLNNCTIRLKHTTKQNYSGSQVWDASGWTVVYQGAKSISSTGWVLFDFITPFAYNGTDNLMVDFSFNNSSYSSSGSVKGFATVSDPRMLYYITDSGYGDPLTWSASPAPYALSFLPQVRFESGGAAVTSLPASSGTFAGGVWTGQVSVAPVTGSVSLKASSGASIGTSNFFVLSALGAPASLAEPPVTGGTSNTFGWGAVAGASAYEAQASANAGFSSPVSSGDLAGTSFAFDGLSDGSLYYYRVRAKSLQPPPPSSWLQSEQSDFVNDTKSNVDETASPGDVVLAATGSIWTESFDGAGSTASGTIFKDGSFNRSAMSGSYVPNTAPPLPINALGDMEAVLTNSAAALMENVPDNVFSNGSIEGYVLSSMGTTGVPYTGFVLRGSGPVSSVSGYAVIVLNYTSGTTSNIGLAKLSSGDVSWLYPTVSFTKESTSENLRVKFQAQGSTLTVSLWRVSASGGNVVETPVILEGGTNSIVRTDSTYTSGRAGLYSNGTYSQRPALFDDVTVKSTSTGYVSSGQLTSTLLSPATVWRWGKVDFQKTVTAPGTALTVDVLDSAGMLLAPNVAPQTDLNLIPAVASKTSIRLRANLSTSIAANSPALNSWSIGYYASNGTSSESAWSSAVSSLQDNTPPQVTLVQPLNPLTNTFASSIATQGAATDANGVASVTVNGVPATLEGTLWNRLVSNLFVGLNPLTIEAKDSAVPPNVTTVNWQVNRMTQDQNGNHVPDAWETAHNLSLAEDSRFVDSDGDGICNWMEYALNLDPRTAGREGLPVTTIELNPADGKHYIVFRYRQRTGVTDLAYKVEVSGDLVTWSSSANIEQVGAPVPDDGGVTETVTFRILPAAENTPSRFVRLKIVVP